MAWLDGFLWIIFTSTAEKSTRPIESSFIVSIIIFIPTRLNFAKKYQQAKLCKKRENTQYVGDVTLKTLWLYS
jgi:hypothetical protein